MFGMILVLGVALTGCRDSRVGYRAADSAFEEPDGVLLCGFLSPPPFPPAGRFSGVSSAGRFSGVSSLM